MMVSFADEVASYRLLSKYSAAGRMLGVLDHCIHPLGLNSNIRSSADFHEILQTYSLLLPSQSQLNPQNVEADGAGYHGNSVAAEVCDQKRINSKQVGQRADQEHFRRVHQTNYHDFHQDHQLTDQQGLQYHLSHGRRCPVVFRGRQRIDLTTCLSRNYQILSHQMVHQVLY